MSLCQIYQTHVIIAEVNDVIKQFYDNKSFNIYDIYLQIGKKLQILTFCSAIVQ